MGTADVRDVVLVTMHCGPLGRLGIGGDEGEVMSGATSGRTSAVAGMGGGSTGTSSTLATKSVMGGKAVQAEGKGVGGA